jgi:hypothetical protein
LIYAPPCKAKVVAVKLMVPVLLLVIGTGLPAVIVVDELPLIVPELFIVVPPLKFTVVAEKVRLAPLLFVKVTGLLVVKVLALLQLMAPELFRFVPPLSVIVDAVAVIFAPLLFVILPGLPLVSVDAVFKLILPELSREALPVREKAAPVKFITPPLLLVYFDPLPVSNEVEVPPVMVPELESPDELPKLILEPAPVNVIVAPLLLVTAVVSELGPPVEREQLVKVKYPLLTRNPGVDPELIVSVPVKLMVLPEPTVKVVVLNIVEPPHVVVPLPFQVKFELVCTAIPPVIVLPAAFVVKVLFPPGLDGVCNAPLIVRVPFKVQVEADRFTLAAEMVPLEFEFIVPLLTVMVLETDSGALTVRVTVVAVPIVSAEQLALEFITG